MELYENNTTSQQANIIISYVDLYSQTLKGQTKDIEFETNKIQLSVKYTSLILCATVQSWGIFKRLKKTFCQGTAICLHKGQPKKI